VPHDSFCETAEELTGRKEAPDVMRACGSGYVLPVVVGDFDSYADPSFHVKQILYGNSSKTIQIANLFTQPIQTSEKAFNLFRCRLLCLAFDEVHAHGHLTYARE
jgi:hypothetical protein